MPQDDPAASVVINPLVDLHRQAEAEFQSYGPIEIVSTYGEPQAEYGAIHKACGLLDRPQRGIVELTGRDRLSFLNNLISNQIWDKAIKSGLAPGQGVNAFLLQAKNGRIICDLNVLELGDRTLLELDARLVEVVFKELDRYRFSEAVELKDRRADLHQISLLGPGAKSIFQQAMDASPAPLDQPLSTTIGRMLGSDVVVFRDDLTGRSGLHLIVPSTSARQIWMHLITRFGERDEAGKRALRQVGWATFNTARIEAGRPLFGIDFDDHFVPAETGPTELNRAVSFTKGCYPGQEIVARMHARGQVAKQVVGFRMQTDALPIAGAQVMDKDDDVVGAVTSSTISPVLSNAAIGFAIIKRPHFEIGNILRIPAEGLIVEATITQPPFIVNAPT